MEALYLRKMEMLIRYVPPSPAFALKCHRTLAHFLNNLSLLLVHNTECIVVSAEWSNWKHVGTAEAVVAAGTVFLLLGV